MQHMGEPFPNRNRISHSWQRLAVVFLQSIMAWKYLISGSKKDETVSKCFQYIALQRPLQEIEGV
jgi:hypothetical protein